MTICHLSLLSSTLSAIKNALLAILKGYIIQSNYFHIHAGNELSYGPKEIQCDHIFEGPLLFCKPNKCLFSVSQYHKYVILLECCKFTIQHLLR